MITNPKEMIDRFQGEWAFLSNFHPCRVAYDGAEYPSAEHAFQATKTNDAWRRRLIASCESAGQAKKVGRKLEVPRGWKERRVALMTEIVRAKFTQNPGLAKRLLRTGRAKLAEGNTWHDTFWGVDAESGDGENNLGRILMAVREELRAGAAE